MAGRSRKGAAVEFNRAALDAIDLGLAKGLESLAFKVLQTVKVPDIDVGWYYSGARQGVPYSRPSSRRGEHRMMGEGLIDRSGFVSYVDGKKVGGTPDTKKPRAFTVRGRGVAVAVGFGFPGRFVEIGTEHQPARPFLTPAVMQVVGDRSVVENAVRESLRAQLDKRARRNLRSSLKARA